MDKIKVLHLISTSIFSGAENVACQIIDSFKNDENFEMVYCSVIKENKPNLISREINYKQLEKFSYNAIRKAINEYNPDIIHAHDIKASLIAAMFKNKKRVIISHVHCNDENMRKMTIKSLLFKLSGKMYKKILWVSKSALEDYKYKKNVIEKSVVLYNVVDSKKVLDFLNKDKNNYSFDAIYLGRLEYVKNPLRLIELINKVKKQKNDFKMAIVGTGTLKDAVIEKIKELGLENNITLFGYVDNPYKILSCSKIMIMTSIYEGTPMVALEAMSLGKPTISTPTDGMIDIITNDVNGYLSDSDEELAEKIIYYTSNDDFLNIINKNVMKINKEINNIDNYFTKVKKVYLEK